MEIIFYTLKQVATLVSGLGKKKKLFILIYHRVLDEPDFMRPDEVDKKKFTWQMQLLAKYFNVLPLAVALEKMKNNTLPARAVCITFDDGYADNYLNAYPILKQNKISATFFIASGYLDGGRMWNDTIIETLRDYPEPQLDLTTIKLGKYSTGTETEKARSASQIIQEIKHLDSEQRIKYTDYITSFSDNLPTNLMLTSEQLIELKQGGMEIGGHTVTHPIMAKISAEQLQQEIADNKKKLETLIQTVIYVFAYPNGKPGQDYLLNQIQVVKDNGYQAAVSTQWGVANKNSDYYQLPRFTPWDTQPVKFLMRIIYMYIKARKD